MANVTLKDVAARAGVSYQTVSKVLNGRAQVRPETQERIWQAVRELNYTPNVSARNLRKQASNLIGYPWHYIPDDFIHPILDAFVHSVTQAAEARGYHLLTFVPETDSSESQDDVYRTLFWRNQVAGFILADTVENDPRVALLIEQEIPFVTFGRANDDWDFCWVDVDGYHGLRLTVEHLLEQGHRRIAFLGWPAGSQTGAHREQGYRDALAAAGVEPDPDWILRGEHSAQLGRTAVRQLLAMPEADRPTALACVSDLVAIGALNEANRAGTRVGEDLAITGFDDMPLVQYMQPPLTSVRQPIIKVGEAVVDLLFKQIEEEPIEQKGILLKPELVIRESS